VNSKQQPNSGLADIDIKSYNSFNSNISIKSFSLKSLSGNCSPISRIIEKNIIKPFVPSDSAKKEENIHAFLNE
jgi:hypothetical protein